MFHKDSRLLKLARLFRRFASSDQQQTLHTTDNPECTGVFRYSQEHREKYESVRPLKSTRPLQHLLSTHLSSSKAPAIAAFLDLCQCPQHRTEQRCAPAHVDCVGLLPTENRTRLYGKPARGLNLQERPATATHPHAACQKKACALSPPAGSLGLFGASSGLFGASSGPLWVSVERPRGLSLPLGPLRVFVGGLFGPSLGGASGLRGASAGPPLDELPMEF